MDAAEALILRTLRRRGVALSGELCEAARDAGMGVGRLYDALRDLEAARVVGSRTFPGRPKRVIWWIWGAP